MSKVLLATPLTMRRGMKSGEVYDTANEWLDNSQRVDKITDAFIFLNDIPIPRRIEIMELCDRRGINYEYEDYGYEPDQRNRATRNPEAKGDKDRNWTYLRFYTVRNRVLDYALNKNYDYVFSVDSDIICRPDTVTQILHRMDSPEVALVSVLVDNMVYTMRSQKPLPMQEHTMNCGNYDHDSIKPIKRMDMKKDCMSVKYTGACCLINMEYVRQGARYGPAKNGEDVYFCEQIRNLGGRILCITDPDLEALHVQDDYLREYIESYLAGGRPYDK